MNGDVHINPTAMAVGVVGSWASGLLAATDAAPSWMAVLMFLCSLAVPALQAYIAARVRGNSQAEARAAAAEKLLAEAQTELVQLRAKYD